MSIIEASKFTSPATVKLPVRDILAGLKLPDTFKSLKNASDVTASFLKIPVTV